MQTLDQKRAILREDVTVADFLTGGGGDNIVVNGQSRHVTGYMKDFLFGPEQARQPVRVLSGGERGRLMLAKALAAPANLLVLDEPTNDLDLETLDLLQETLADHPGTVIVVSHDRDFIDRVATSVIFAEGNGRFTEYAGGYTDMLAQRGAGVAAKTVIKTAKTAAPTATASPARKLSFKDKHALEKLPGEIDAMQAELAKLQTRIEDPTLYARDRKTFDAAMARIAVLTTTIAQAEEKWLELEALRESLEA
jgi:ATP-binding cassette subfamily F protein uup